MSPSIRNAVFLCALASSIFLAGCLVNKTLEGTVAGGSAVTGTVTVTDSLGAGKMVNIDANGHYSVNVSGMTGPFVIKASGSLGNMPVTYYSAATSDDIGNTVNVTPLTNLMVSNLSQQLAETYFSSADNLNGFTALLTTAKLTAAEAALRAKLKPALNSLGISSTTDLLHSAFVTNHTGVDALLDLVKVEDDTSTNLVTLKNALTQEVIGTDDVTLASDDAIPVDASKIAGIDPSGSSDWLAINTLLNSLSAPFATSLPSTMQLQGTGIFDDSANLIVNGKSLDALTGDSNNIGMQLNDVRIFLDGSHAAGLVQAHFTSATQNSARTFNLAVSMASGSWKITSDANYLGLGINTGATYTFGYDGWTKKTTLMSSLQILVDPTAYNNTHSQKVAMFKISGPGLNKGTEYSYAPVVQALPANSLILFVAGVAPFSDPTIMQLAECKVPASKRCVTMAQINDNSEYTIVMMDYNGVVLNGSGYKLILPKAPPTTSTFSVADFPALTSASIAGQSLLPNYGTVSSAMSLVSGSIPVTWTMPVGFQATSLRASYSETSGAFFSQALTPDQTSTDIQPIPSKSRVPCLYFWLSGTDSDGRVFTTKYIFANTSVWVMDGLYGGCMP
jgi:hypothetical protein